MSTKAISVFATAAVGIVPTSTASDRSASCPGDHLCRVAAMNFGIRFDLRNPHSPESLAEAVKYVQLWAKREGIEIPEGL